MNSVGWTGPIIVGGGEKNARCANGKKGNSWINLLKKWINMYMLRLKLEIC